MRDRSGESGVKVWYDFSSLAEVLKLKRHEKSDAQYRYWLFEPQDVAQAANDANDRYGARRAWQGGLICREELVQFINDGWPDGVAKMRESIKRLQFPGAKSIRRRRVWADSGDEIDMQRVYSGDVDRAWHGTRRELGEGGATHIKIWIQTGFTGDHSPEDYFWRGAVGCMISDALEEVGYRVEISGYYMGMGRLEMSRDNLRDTIFTYPLKAFDEPLDLERIATVTAHAAWHRIGSFCASMATPYKIAKNMGVTDHRPPPFEQEGEVVIRGISKLKEAEALLSQLATRFGAAEITT